MTQEREKWQAERIIDDVEHYGRKLKAESQLSVFNEIIKPRSSQSHGNLGLLLGSMFFLIIISFLGLKVLSNNEQRTQTPQPSNLQSLPIAP